MAGLGEMVYSGPYRILLSEDYLPLEQVNSVDEFKEVFLDVQVVRGAVVTRLVEDKSCFFLAHHHVYNDAGMLHGDMSDKNIMFLRQGGRAHGRLCDWDLTKHVRASAALDVPGL
jgi:hypothetical protein